MRFFRTITLLSILALFGANYLQAQCYASFTSSEVNGTLTFTASASNVTNPGYYWDFGDGSNGTGATVSHTYANSIWHRPCLTVIDSSNGCVFTRCDSILITSAANSPCQAAFNLGSAGYTGFFNDISVGGPFSYFWDFGDGDTAHQNVSSHQYPANGVYDVCLTVSNGSCSDTLCQPLVVSNGPPCHAKFFVSFEGNTVLLTNLSSGGTNPTYFWDFGNGQTSTAVSPSVTLSPGWHTICLTYSAQGCNSTICRDVLVPWPPLCNASFYTYPDTTGQYGIIAVNNSTGLNLSYLWDFGDGNTSTQAYPQHTYAGTGTYVVCLTVSSGSCSSSHCDTIQVTQKVASTLTINVISPNTGLADLLPLEGVEVFPNPFADNFKTRIELQSGQEINVELIDFQGRSLGLHQGYLPAGSHEITFEGKAAPAGIYFLKVSNGNKVNVTKLMKTK